MIDQSTHDKVKQLPLNEVYELAEMMVYLRDKSIETDEDIYIKGVAVCNWDGEGCGQDVNGEELINLIKEEIEQINNTRFGK